MKKKAFKRGKCKLVVNYGLHKIGKQSPYFSVTGDLYEGNTREPFTCGCIHDIIRKWTTEFNDLIALHLCKDDGQPSYAVDNGFHFYAEGVGVDGRPGYARDEGHKKELEDAEEEGAYLAFAGLWDLPESALRDVWLVARSYQREKYDSALFQSACDIIDGYRRGRPKNYMVNARNNKALAKHLRITEEEAEEIPAGLTKEEFERLYITPNLDRWRAEAMAAIEKHGLREDA